MTPLPLLPLLIVTVALMFATAPTFAEPVLPAGGGWDNPPVRGQLPRGVVHKTFRSASMGVNVGYNVYLPPGYDEPANGGRRYPVVYWLHGLGGNENGTFPADVADRAIREGSLPPVIIVLANGGARTRYHDSVDGKIMGDTLVSKELIGHVDATYRTVASREGRSVQGVSMGANGALKFGFKYPELFSSVVAYMPALVDGAWMALNDREFLDTMFAGDESRYQRETAAEVIRRNADVVRGKVAVLIRIGTKDSEGLLTRARAMHRLLDDLKVPHGYEEVEGVTHDLGRLVEKTPTQGLVFAAEHSKHAGS